MKDHEDAGGVLHPPLMDTPGALAKQRSELIKRAIRLESR